jgi:hypothetical protein
MLSGLTTNVELLMLALDVLVEAEQLVSSTGAGVVLLVVAVLLVELVCVSMVLLVLLFLTIKQFSVQRNEQQLHLATDGPVLEFSHLTRLPVFD